MSKEKIVECTFSLHPKGFGFATPTDTTTILEDIFIPKNKTLGAINGDKVRVKVSPNVSKKGPDGLIIEIISRKRDTFVGTVAKVLKKECYYIYTPALGEEKLICADIENKPKYSVGDRVLVKITHWSDEEYIPEGVIHKKIGHIDDATTDNSTALLEYEIRTSFPKAVMREIAQLPSKLIKVEERKDLTHLETLTIDPTTAKDFDDALSIEKHAKGYTLGVHIADVSHFVKPGSAIDEEARQRFNSTYLPNQCSPMLPEELSNNLCSLKPGVIRYTASVLMEFNPQGELQNYAIHRAMIKSRKRFTYEEAREVLDDKRDSPYKKSLQDLAELGAILKQARKDRGSIDFSVDETYLLIDPKTGHPIKYITSEYDITHQLVEEFMLKANELIAKHLSDHGKNAIYRVHEEPHEASMQAFYQLARNAGYQLSDNPSTDEIQALFDEVKESPFGSNLTIAFIRSMKMAIYSPENVGHFGLCLEYYAHFTSPIRRYSDLVVHRELFHEGSEKDLKLIADCCSSQERISERAEKSVKAIKELRYLETLKKKQPKKTYTAVISKIQPIGLFFELKEFPITGFIHISEIGRDFYLFDPKEATLTGRNTHENYKVLDEITVRIRTVDLILQEAEWDMLS